MAKVSKAQPKDNPPSKEFKNNVLEANPDLAYVLSAHLFIESLLIEWLSLILPKPQKLFSDFRPTFQQIVALCQAHNLFDDDLALVIKKLNSLRNRFSHNLLYKPDSTSIKDFLESLREMRHPFYVSFVDPTEREMSLALAALCGYIQKHVKDYKELRGSESRLINAGE